MGLYLQQLSELELLFSEVQAGGGAESQELEQRMQLAEEMLRTILGEALSLQGTAYPLPSDGAVCAATGEGFAACSEFLFSLPHSFSPASDRSLEGRVARMKGQESSSQSRLDEVKATVGRLQSLGSQYERQVQETQQLLERAKLDLDRSGAALRRVVRASSCNLLLVWPRAEETSMEKARI